ncbi:MAG: thioredoxin [Desulfobacteraceae bacterium]|nr:MAG: thioredoxin [Desulfobacteraceae bacterium]
MSELMEVSDKSFEAEVIQSEKPVVIDFWAPWCGPCKAIAPVIEALSAEYRDSVVFAKFNVDENPVIPAKYGIRSIPTVLFFKGGKPVEKITGLTSRAKLEEAIRKVQSGAAASQPFIVT